MARWSEYFQKLLNVPGDIEPEAMENIQQRSVNTALNEKPTMDEMVRTIKGLKEGKVPGGDGNYRGISLLSAANRIFARILLNRLSIHI